MAKDMYQKRKERKEKKEKSLEENNDRDKLQKNSINWYPGHMAKTRRQIEEDLKLIDVVIELLDARIPISSRNPDIKKITKGKKRIILLNKYDLADEKMTSKWVELLSEECPVLVTDSNTGRGVDRVTKKIDDIMKEEVERQRQRGIINKTIRVMILGIPNVGKSSFINRITKSSKLEVGNKPGVTKSKQWIRISKNQILLDTPGVLWPKFENSKVAHNLAYTGTIKDDILERVDVAYELIKLLMNKHKVELMQRYKINEEEMNEAEMQPNAAYEVMILIARKRGAIVSGGNVDDEKVARIILDDFRSCKIGKITLEEPR